MGILDIGLFFVIQLSGAVNNLETRLSLRSIVGDSFHPWIVTIFNLKCVLHGL